MGAAAEAKEPFSVLVVDDSEDILDLVELVLRKEGCAVKRAQDGRSALRAAFEKPAPDLILLDVEMPGASGYDVCRAMKASPAVADVPVVFLTQRTDTQDVLRGFQLGAIDYFTKPIAPPVLAARLRAHIELVTRRNQQERLILERSAQLEHTRLQLIRRLGRAMEYHESSAVGNRVVRLAHYARILSAAAGARAGLCDLMMKAAPLHDIGKLGVPTHILRKTEKLSVPEREQMQRHPEIGASIIGEHNDPLLGLARTLALTHHERWDGSGYPSGAKASDIPWPGRVMAVVDVFEGMTATQFHRDPIPLEIAAQEIVRGAGTQFDPQIVEAFRKALPAFRDVRERYADALGDMLDLDFSAERPAIAHASSEPPPSDPAIEERALRAIKEADDARAKALAETAAKLKVERDLAAAATKDLATQQAARKRAEEEYARDAELLEATKRRIAEEAAAARAAQERAKVESDAATIAREAEAAKRRLAAEALAREEAERALAAAQAERRAADEAHARAAAEQIDAHGRALQAAKARSEETDAARQAEEARLAIETRLQTERTQLASALRSLRDERAARSRAEDAYAHDAEVLEVTRRRIAEEAVAREAEAAKKLTGEALAREQAERALAAASHRAADMPMAAECDVPRLTSEIQGAPKAERRPSHQMAMPLVVVAAGVAGAAIALTLQPGPAPAPPAKAVVAAPIAPSMRNDPANAPPVELFQPGEALVLRLEQAFERLAPSEPAK